MGDLTTLAAAKEWLGISPSSFTDDALLTNMVARVSAAAESFMGRTIASTAYTETHNGRGLSKLAFGQVPVISVASVTINGTAIPARNSPTSSGFAFDQQLLYLCGYTFTRGVQNVVVQYTAGFASVPTDIEQAVLELIALRYVNKDRVGVSSKALAGEQISWFHNAPTDVMDVLDQYRRTYVGGYAP